MAHNKSVVEDAGALSNTEINQLPLNPETLRETVDDAVYELRLAVKGLTDAVCKLKTERTVNVDRHGNMSRA